MITGLVLQGGGALGAFELGVIEWMLDNRVAPDVVSGVSIGALNAAVLAGSKEADPRQGLRALWAELTTPAWPPPFDGANAQISLFGNAAMYAPRLDYVNLWRWTSLYETAPLRRTLERHVDFEKLGPQNFARPAGARAPRLILTATNLVTGKLDRFDSLEMRLTAEHVAAIRMGGGSRQYLPIGLFGFGQAPGGVQLCGTAEVGVDGVLALAHASLQAYRESAGFRVCRAQGWRGGCAPNQDSPDFLRKSGVTANRRKDKRRAARGIDDGS